MRDTDRALELAERAPLSWDPVQGGKRSWMCFEDDKTYDLGKDEDGTRFRDIADRMILGRYYPPDALRVRGRFQDEGRPLRQGDRILQSAPLFGKFGGPSLNSAVEMFVVEREAARCKIGYVTTIRHHGRGIWSSELTSSKGRLWLHVKGTACPNSWLFWLGLPLARAVQKRAWRRAVEVFREL